MQRRQTPDVLQQRISRTPPGPGVDYTTAEASYTAAGYCQCHDTSKTRSCCEPAGPVCPCRRFRIKVCPRFEAPYPSIFVRHRNLSLAGDSCLLLHKCAPIPCFITLSLLWAIFARPFQRKSSGPRATRNPERSTIAIVSKTLYQLLRSVRAATCNLHKQTLN